MTPDSRPIWYLHRPRHLLGAKGEKQPNSSSGIAAPQQSNLMAPREAGAKSQGESAAAPKRAPEVNIDAASGQPYVIYEGTTVDTVLMNRLDGDAVGPRQGACLQSALLA